MDSRQDMSQDQSRINTALEMAKKLTSQIRGLSKSLKIDQDFERNSSTYQEVSLAEFSSIYDADKFSALLNEQQVTNFEDIKQEVKMMKEETKRSLIQTFIKKKMNEASQYLEHVKSKIKQDTMQRYIDEKSLGNSRFKQQLNLPTIAKEVVKRCQQPKGYMQFKRHHDFLPTKILDPNEQYKSPFRNGKKKQKFIKMVKQQPIRLPSQLSSRQGAPSKKQTTNESESQVLVMKIQQRQKLKERRIRRNFNNRSENQNNTAPVTPQNITNIEIHTPIEYNYTIQQSDGVVYNIAEPTAQSQINMTIEGLNSSPTQQILQISQDGNSKNNLILEQDQKLVTPPPLLEKELLTPAIVQLQEFLNDQPIGKSNLQLPIIDEFTSSPSRRNSHRNLKDTKNSSRFKKKLQLHHSTVPVRGQPRQHHHQASGVQSETEENEELLKLVIERYWQKYNALRPLKNTSQFTTTANSTISESNYGFGQQQKLLLEVLKIISIERNLQQQQFRNLLLGSIKYLVEKELSDLQLVTPSKADFIEQVSTNLTSKSVNKSVSPSRFTQLSSKLNSLNFFETTSKELHQLQIQLRGEKQGLQGELASSEKVFDQIESFYDMIREGDMPHQRDAQILFEVKKLDAIWQYKEQYLQIRRFKQISDGSSQGMLTIQKYEHIKFVRENAKRRQELKNMG